jgi:hypothetical protein
MFHRGIERFYHPRCDRWSEHFQRLEVTGAIEPLTAIGRSTIRLL